MPGRLRGRPKENDTPDRQLARLQLLELFLRHRRPAETETQTLERLRSLPSLPKSFGIRAKARKPSVSLLRGEVSRARREYAEWKDYADKRAIDIAPDGRNAPIPFGGLMRLGEQFERRQRKLLRDLAMLLLPRQTRNSKKRKKQ